jgi:hypothetical protein
VKAKSKKIGIIVAIVVIIACFAGYFGHKTYVKNAEEKAQIAKENKEEHITINEDKTKELKKEKILLNGKVYVKDKKVIATMVVKESSSDSDAKALANKYAKELKEEYKNMPVYVMAVKNNKNVANISIK